MIPNRSIILTSLLVIICALSINFNLVNNLFQYYYKQYFTSVTNNDQVTKHIYTPETLAKYNGIDKKKLYLAILGKIFDVTEGKNHYEKGAGYNFFIGKDGSRSFITGNFSDESNNKDHVIDLPCIDLFALKNWMDTYKKKYLYKGKLIGRYYDKHGEVTQYNKELVGKLRECILEKQMKEAMKTQYPPCNIEWSADTGSRVWCTMNSGGIVRDWVGVPRKHFTPDSTTPQCVCVDLPNLNSMTQFKEYDNCPPDAVSCRTV